MSTQPTAEENRSPILRVKGLTTEIRTAGGTVRAVNGVDFVVYPGEMLGIVGESGSGKSVTMLSLLGLLPPAARVTAGTAQFGDIDLLAMSERRLRAIRGKRIAMIFQDPMTALNPVMTISEQISESLRRHSPELGRRQRRQRVIDLLQQVRIPRAAERAHQYPHEFSGGMRQRAMIAMAMANGPELLLADEPTTALDVTVQAQILDLLSDMQAETGTAVVLITHDLGVIAEVADWAAVMYAGRVVERASVADLFHVPKHPYTAGLVVSRPTVSAPRSALLPAIAGHPPNPAALPVGCPFRLRCTVSKNRSACRVLPELVQVGTAHETACHFHDEVVVGSHGTPSETVGTRDGVRS